MRVGIAGRNVVGALAVLAFALGGCGTGGSSEPMSPSESEEAPDFDRSEATTEAAYTLVDYRFEGPLVVKGPRVFFTAVNKGVENHELEVLDSKGEAVGEIEAFAPGPDEESLALTLEPGSYTLQCILETDDGKVHRDLGMAANLTVE